MAQTANYGFEKPSTDKDVDEEFYQLQETLDLLDAILAALQTAVNGKSALGHTHAISDIVNLAAELAAKMPASQTFKLDDLTDVSGADGAPNNYVLVKTALGWLPSSALAALGTHGHLISEITGLVDALAKRVPVDAPAGFTGPEKAQGRTNIGAQADLGFTPVQQGTGIGQLGNAVKIGWDGNGRLKATVDGTDIGGLWADNLGGNLKAAKGYQVLPSGIILQWGGELADRGADYIVTLPVAMPWAIANIQVTVVGNTGAIIYASADSASPTGFAMRVRNAAGGAAAANIHWLVTGY